MNFYIKKLKLWFKTHQQPITYEFEPDKVNVITGNSSTGKSSILRIIDYCLFSPESSIVEDVINQNVLWYGLIFHLDGHDYAVARTAPFTGTVTKDIYWKEDCDDFSDSYPIPTTNIGRVELEQWMDEKFHVAGIEIEEKKKTFQIHFRHMMMLSYLTEDIIATLNTYFDTNFFGEREYFRYLPNILQVGLGMDAFSVKDLEQSKETLIKKIRKEEATKKKDAENEKKYLQTLSAIIEEAISLGLISSTPDVGKEVETVFDGIERFKNELNRIKRGKTVLNEIDSHYIDLHNVRKQLRDLNSLKREYERSCRYAQTIKESITPMEFLVENLDVHILSDETIMLYKSLEKAFRNIENVEFKVEALPSDFQEKYVALQEQESNLLKRIEYLEKTSKIELNSEKIVTALELAARLKVLERKPSKYVGDIKVANTKEDVKEISCQIENLKTQNDLAIKELNQNIQTYYDIQSGMSDSYRNCEVSFDLENATLRVRKKDEYAYIRNVGSKSNYMFLHLCFFLGLHEFISSRKNVRVPNFLFIDQPSIPYFSHREGNKLSNERGMYVSTKDDEAKLKAAFSLIDNFMSQNISNDKDEHFQIIMVEHADPEYWNDLPYFVTRYVFTEDKDYGLIPKYIVE